MLAIIYLIAAALLGDVICRRFFRFVSLPHRLAAAFLTGLLISTWATYLFSLAFASTENPLLWGNLFFAACSIIILFFCQNQISLKSLKISQLENHNTDRSDWFFIALVFVFSLALMFGMFVARGEYLKVNSIVWNDFGPNLSLVQSFAAGHNFPTEYPHFIGETIRYHFLFWFQAGNLTFLGLGIDWSLNLLSALTMTAMLVLLVVLGQAAFDSKAVGRIGALLFFFYGTLSYIPFLLSMNSFAEVFHSIFYLQEWLNSIYPYAGEQWGVWSFGTFLAQRHLPTSIGVFLIVLIFLIKQIREKTSAAKNNRMDLTKDEKTDQNADDNLQNNQNRALKSLPVLERVKSKIFDRTFQAYLFSGVLLGLLPLWNSAVYLSAFAVVAGLSFVFPHRVNTIYLLIASNALAVPQILFLRAGSSRSVSEILRWGYVVDPPTFFNVLKYFSFTFGIKTLTALFALIFLSAFHRRLFIALLVLPVLAFGTHLSSDIMNNHKFLHIWIILINLFVACALLYLTKRRIAGKIVAALLAAAITLGGAIELFKIKNYNMTNVPFNNGRLYKWLYQNTQPEDVFLTDKYIHHPILLSGRRIFYGWTYFGWSMNYPVDQREPLYQQMLLERDTVKLIRLLNANNIKYVAIDNGLRNGELKNVLNEAVYEKYFQKVFVDDENKYNSLVIYKVPPAGSQTP